jgi:shikimate kinase
MHLYLIGFMGSGKTSVGTVLAEKLGWEFVDLDELIEKRADMKVSEIFECLGEPEFRRMEESALREISQQEPKVVATGGGTLIEPRNRELLSERGVTVFLDVPLSIVEERLGSQTSQSRPLYRDRDQIASLYRDRLPMYRAADLHVAIESDTDASEVADLVQRLLEESQCDI